WSLFRAVEPQEGLGLRRAAVDVSEDARAVVPEPGDRSHAVDDGLLLRLERLMTVERAYRREGLTIGSLSAELGVPEYRLRQLINEGLGHRNFSSFVNGYRL